MKRRQFLKDLVTGTAAISTFSFYQCSRIKRKPNIVLIMVDDFGYECIRANGGTSYETPFIDSLANTGMRFTHCYSMPLCTPSRVQIMTGKYNFRNYTEFGALKPGEYTFGNLFQQNGYKTCVAGKWQLAGSVKGTPQVGKGTMPNDAGFDEYCLWHLNVREKRYWYPVINQNGKMRDDIHDRFGPDVFVDYINDFVSRNQKDPFFVYYPMALTHDPFLPTPDDNPTEEEKESKGPENFPSFVRYTDKMVKRIVDNLDKLGLRENTLILFTGDNGTHKSIISQLDGKPLRGDKGMPTIAGTHVPLIANWPGTITEGVVKNDLVDFTDFFPTLAETAGIEPPVELYLDGHSFLPQLKGETGNPREWVFCHYDPRWGTRPSARYVHNKYLKLYGDGRIFNIASDPLEEKPLEFENMDRVSQETIREFEKVLKLYRK